MMLNIKEVKLFTPFRYEKGEAIYMIIGVLNVSYGYKIACLRLDKDGSIYCVEAPDINLVVPAGNKVNFIKAILNKCIFAKYDQSLALFYIAFGKDVRKERLQDF